MTGLRAIGPRLGALLIAAAILLTGGSVQLQLFHCHYDGKTRAACCCPDEHATPGERASSVDRDGCCSIERLELATARFHRVDGHDSQLAAPIALAAAPTDLVVPPPTLHAPPRRSTIRADHGPPIY